PQSNRQFTSLSRSCIMTAGLSKCSSFFSFYRSGPPRGLHSFPTRRSSDLSAGQVHCPIAVQRHSSCRLLFGGPGDGKKSGVEPRSEEHTSELQSRGHLVCRLLLEKKKLMQQP